MTPPIFQSQPLLARHLPPQTLPFQNFASRVAETAQQEEVAEEQQAALRVLQESEEQASHSRSATDELEQARQTIRLLEQGQVGSGVRLLQWVDLFLSFNPRVEGSKGITSGLVQQLYAFTQ